MNEFFWKTIVGAKSVPQKDLEKRRTFKKSLQQLYVAGTLGAFFSALARNLPADIFRLRSAAFGNVAIDRCIRYGYVFWLLTYFFVSNTENDRRKASVIEPWDITYDIIQSLFSLVALFVLGFIVDTPYKLGAYAWTNLAIAAICFLSLVWFRESEEAKNSGINRLRWAGFVVSAVSVLFALFCRYDAYVLLSFAFLQLGLWAFLSLFVYIRAT